MTLAPLRDPAHRALVLRTLAIDEATLRSAEERFQALAPESLAERLRALEVAWAAASPHATPLPETWGPASCPACGGSVRPAVARRAGESRLIYGRCLACGHGLLLEGKAPSSIYGAGYFQCVEPGGAGYAAYEAERAYRESKGGALLDWIAAAARRPVATLCEVGSGFGFTRRAAELRGMKTAGIDWNPHAESAARRLYGMATFSGTLDQALASRAIAEQRADLVLYQFVLEHIGDPIAELRSAVRAAAPSGLVALLVPSMDAVELEVLGASYRSLRSDHLHLFSRRSISLCLGAAGLSVVAMSSGCNLDLMAGFVGAEDLERLYADGRGPDLRVLAQREPVS